MTIPIMKTAFAAAAGVGQALSGLRRHAVSLSLVPVLLTISMASDAGAVDLRDRQRPRPAICTMDYAPVCGKRGRDTQTFSNACMARSKGYQVIDRGQCRRQPSTRVCTREYAPVCGRKGSRSRTFGNACEAGAAGFLVTRRGECRR